MTPTPSRSCTQRAAAGLALFATLLCGCGNEQAVLEVAWAFIDRAGNRIFPAGFSLTRGDSCSLPGRIGDRSVRYDLEVELSICDPSCAGGCDDALCSVVDPLRFSCETARGSDPNIPSSDDPYVFTFRSLVVAPNEGIECRDPAPTCIAVPGPRQRTVTAGLVTDLQVYEVIVDVDLDAGGTQAELDLEACGCA